MMKIKSQKPSGERKGHKWAEPGRKERKKEYENLCNL
jgi:hypothetical protein